MMKGRVRAVDCLWVVLAAVLGCGAALPEVKPGPDADVLARKMMAAVQDDAWRATGAVQWTFAGKRAHLWDRRRQFAQISWDETRVLLDVNGRRGLAWKAGEPLTGDAAVTAVDAGHAGWVNDAFWLNPVSKAFDPGTTRARVQGEGREGVLVRYTSGGRTPGDAYLWWLGADGTPTAWQMWTSNIPIGGLEASWAGWQALSTGARISTEHSLAVKTLKLTDVKGAATLGALLAGPDPFAALVDCAAAKCVQLP
jgi:hypothetical protein